MSRPLALLLLCAGLTLAQGQAPISVGVRGVLEGVVGPADLEPRRPAAGRPPLVVRVLRAAPHGAAFRYDLEYYGLEAGRYDLRDYLQRADGTRPDGLEALPVAIKDPLLALDPLAPEALDTGRLPERGGYRAALFLVGAVWLLGLGWLAWGALGGRRRARAAAQAPTVDPLAALAATAGERELDTAERGQLERLLLERWCLAAGLSEQAPSDALVALREDPSYGPRLRALEAWLHHPRPQPADLAQLLAEVQA